MEKNVGIWLDNEKAYIITLLNGDESIEKIESNVETRIRFQGEKKSYSRFGGMWFNPQKKKTARKRHQLQDYFKSILQKTKDASNIYIFGPADAKTHLRKVYQKEKGLNNRLKKIETCDKLTRNQMIAKVREVFRVA